MKKATRSDYRPEDDKKLLDAGKITQGEYDNRMLGWEEWMQKLTEHYGSRDSAETQGRYSCTPLEEKDLM